VPRTPRNAHLLAAIELALADIDRARRRLEDAVTEAYADTTVSWRDIANVMECSPEEAHAQFHHRTDA
jgi:hypothetical protein